VKSGATTGVVPGRTRLVIAIALPPLAWFGYQQGLGMILRSGCSSAAPPFGPAFGAAALIACALAALLGAPKEARYPGRFLASCIAQFGAALFGLAIAFQTIATLVIPSCVA
jgi:hypothetical protein